jgi:RNA polymerase sigma-70 factor (ECF subfamily)
MALRDELATYRGEVDLVRDRILVARSQDGDGSAFAELYTRYHDRLQRFCYRRLHDGEEAADVTQEAFTRAWRALPTFAGERRFYPWLTVIAGNLCTDLLRKRARSQPTDDIERLGARDHEPAAGESTEDSVMAAVDGELVAMALGKLSDRHRRVLTMREASGWTYQEIATYEGVEISTIETLLWRARQALKREYAALSGGALGAVVLAAGTVRNLGARLARRVAMFPAGRGGGVVGSLAVAFTSAAVATVAFLPPGTGQSSTVPASTGLAAVAGPAAAAATSPPPAGVSAVPTASAPAVSSGSSSVAAPSPTGSAANGSTSSVPWGPGATVPATPPASGGSANSTVGSATQPVSESFDPAVGAVGELVPGLTAALGVGASATTQALTDVVGSATQPVSDAVDPVVGAVGELVPGLTPVPGGVGSTTTSGSTSPTVGLDTGGLLSPLP